MIRTVGIYEGDIWIRFVKSGDSWDNISKLPHYKFWLKTLKHLEKRGFEVKTPKYWDSVENSYGRSKHKVAIKEGTVFCLECENSFIKIQFGHFKNLWKDWEFNFWSLTDDRSTPLSYLETKRVELEVNKLLSLLPAEKLNYENDKKLSFEGKVVKELNSNSHIHGKVTCLEDIKRSIESGVGKYNQGRNSEDAEGKKVTCGETKYFYDYTNKRLSYGEVWHNINDMWWVLTPDGNRRNISCFNLFDFNFQSRRKELKRSEKIDKLERIQRQAEKVKNYKHCIEIEKQLSELKGKEKTYKIWSLKHGAWWGANNSGYTNDESSAGVYLESVVLSKQSYYNDGVDSRMVEIFAQ